ncbi:uncharacterized protein K441DRAFT_560250, partial [Cenococcum geophilum 1.58]|uniref:uncharacterized protein n=1 Tax=Cenococcum geophilum 1.58 TaxID=794803 RepID=UPI00358FCE30
YINGPLTKNNRLNTSTKEKPVINVDDIFRVLHHHWAYNTSTFPDGRQSLQLAFLILIYTYIVSRPGVLVYIKRNAKVTYNEDRGVGDGISDDEINDGDRDNNGSEEKDEPINTLCYKYVILILIRELGAKRDLITMEINLRFIKGYRRNSKRKIFCLYKVNDLIFNLIIYIIILGILDNAFKLKFQTIKQVFIV